MVNKQEVLEAVKEDGWKLMNVSPELQNDKEVVLAAVRNYGGALEYASAELQKDKEVVLAAVNNDGEALKYANSELKKDKDFIKELIPAVNIKEYQYAGGANAIGAVDYIIIRGDINSAEFELYAEKPVVEEWDEIHEEWILDEDANYDSLLEEILTQARDSWIDESIILDIFPQYA